MNSPPLLILAIDTSCDETSAAVTLGPVVLANVIASQVNLHQSYGGVHPTIAIQAHLEKIEPVVKQALARALITPAMLDAIAVTVGPGLAPALEIGINFAQKMASTWHKPLLAINHIEAHLLAVLAVPKNKKLPIKKILAAKKTQQKIPSTLSKHWSEVIMQTNCAHKASFPVLGLVISGGHSQFIAVTAMGKYQILGETIDDAAGEALDKVGRILGLGYPAASVIEKLAKHGNPNRFQLPLPLANTKTFDLSYSGLKAAAHRSIQELETQGPLNQVDIVDFAASFQSTVFKHICDKLNKLLADNKMKSALSNTAQFTQIWLGGGVANNIKLRQMICQTLKPYALSLQLPFEKRLCGDNAAMIGVAASYQAKKKPLIAFDSTADLTSTLFDRRPSWSITDQN